MVYVARLQLRHGERHKDAVLEKEEVIELLIPAFSALHRENSKGFFRHSSTAFLFFLFGGKLSHCAKASTFVSSHARHAVVLPTEFW